MWYPAGSGGDVSSPRAELTRLDPSQYREIVYEWPFGDFIIWMEESRVRSEFDEIT